VPDRAAAIQNAASLLSSFCGRPADLPAGGLRTCEHDHTADAQAFVRMVEQYAFPELLRELVAKAEREDSSVGLLVWEKADELEARAAVVEPR
jgi:hypothetical protein